MALAHWANCFKKLNISETFSEIPDSTHVHALWKKLLDVNNLLSIRPENITDVKISEFQSVKRICPYVH